MTNFEISVFSSPLANHELEKALLSALLNASDIFDKIGDAILPDFFSLPFHRALYGRMSAAFLQGEKANPLLLTRDMDEEYKKSFKEISDYHTDGSLAESHLGILRELWQRRELQGMCDEGAVLAPSAMAPEALITKIEERLCKIALPVESEIITSAQAYAELMEEIAARVKKANETFPRTPVLPGLRSGFTQLDDMLGGLQDGHCILLGARPSMGKTALIGNIAHNVASAGDPVGFITYEMTVGQLMLRASASETNVSSDALTRGDLSNTEFDRFQEGAGGLAHLPIHYAYNPGNIDKLLLVMRKLVRVKKCKLLIIDYVNLISGGMGRDATERLGAISAALKLAAGSLGVPIIIACQLNRNLESRDDQRPQLSDLKQSGNLEQDADAVIFLHREIYFLERRRPDPADTKYQGWLADCNRWRGRAELLLRKNRHGRIGESEISFNESTTKFSN